MKYEAREVMSIARCVAAIILLQPKLDENYRSVKAAAFDWGGLTLDGRAEQPAPVEQA